MEKLNTALALAVDDASQVGEARRAATALAARTPMDEGARGALAIVVTEAANNIVRHAGSGTIVLQPIFQDDMAYIDVLALDKGPGMSNIAECLQDGYSTAGTAGEGLGAIQRLSFAFDLFSTPESGTVLFARLWASGEPVWRATLATTEGDTIPRRFDLGVVSLPIRGEEVCGDAWALQSSDPEYRFLVADGLGHGPVAAEASEEAVRIFRQMADSGRTPAHVLETAHGALRHTRGAAAAITCIDTTRGAATFAGVGNIQAAIVTLDGAKSLTSYNGTVGHQARKFADFVYDLPADGVLVMASDGIATQWRLERYPGLLARHPAVIAGVLYRDCVRGRDDATVLVAAPSRITGRVAARGGK